MPSRKAIANGGNAKARLWVTALVAMVVLLTIVIYFAWPAGYTDDKCGDAGNTGIDSPDGDIASGDASPVKTVDSGFETYQTFGGPSEAITFGYVIQNTSHLVLHNARLNIRLSDGGDITDGLSPEDQEDNEFQLQDVRVPLILPNQKVGLGGYANTRSSLVEDPDSGEPIDPPKVDYDNLDIEVEVESGELWEKDNDKYIFPALQANKVEANSVSETDDVYEDGTPGKEYELGYTAKSTSCTDHVSYRPSTVHYSPDGSIVGGSVPNNQGPLDELDPFKPGNNEVPPSTYNSLGYGDDMTIDVFPYAKPSTP